MSSMSAQHFNRDVSAAKRAASDEPVFITSRGRTTHVLLSREDYEHAVGRARSLRQVLAADDDIAFEPPRLDLRLQSPDLQ